jgi:SAM-dependent methyltransferase
MRPNADVSTVASFGDEWSSFDQSELGPDERQKIFDRYFRIFPWSALPEKAEGFDMGCGSGRWAALVAPRVGTLHCIDLSPEALAVARENLATSSNVRFHNASVENAPLARGSQDFGYSLGVLHHIPDTRSALDACVRLLKPGAPFLVYLYYRFDNRPWWYRAVWRASEVFRWGISRLPPRLKSTATDLIAALVYWPLSRTAKLVERLGLNPHGLPLADYRNFSWYTLRTDSRDRFGTPLEQRFTRAEIAAMMQRSGLTDIIFSEEQPYWCACGLKKHDA